MFTDYKCTRSVRIHYFSFIQFDLRNSRKQRLCFTFKFVIFINCLQYPHDHNRNNLQLDKKTGLFSYKKLDNVYNFAI